MALGNQIKIHRTRLGLTLEQLSDASGVEIGTISALENRDSSRSKYATALAAAMGMTVEQLEGLLPSSDTECASNAAQSEKNQTLVRATAQTAGVTSPNTSPLQAAPASQSPLVIAAIRLDRAEHIDDKTKAVATQILQSLLK